MLIFNLASSLDEIQNGLLSVEGKASPKKEADHSALVGINFNKQGKLPMSW